MRKGEGSGSTACSASRRNEKPRPLGSKGCSRQECIFHTWSKQGRLSGILLASQVSHKEAGAEREENNGNGRGLQRHCGLSRPCRERGRKMEACKRPENLARARAAWRAGIHL